MKYFKANISIINGRKVYGNLPDAFVIGHEDDTLAYFELLAEVIIPYDANIEEISFEEYTQAINLISEQIKQKKQEETNKSIEQFEKMKQEKEQRIVSLELDLHNTQNDNLSVMEAAAELYEENLSLKEQNLQTIEALADVYEQLLLLQAP